MSQATFVKKIATELKTGLNSRDSAQLEENMEYWLGDHYDSIKVAYTNLFGSITPLYLNVPQFYGFHTMIAGTTRSGKTTTAKTVSHCTLEETKKYVEGVTYFDVDNQFREFEKYKEVERYDMHRMSWTERFKVYIREFDRIMARDEGEGRREVFFMDEIQNFLPEVGISSKGFTQKESNLRRICKETIIDGLQQCLKRNVSCVLIAPTITRTAKQAMDMCGTKILHQLENTDSVRKLAETIPRRYYRRILKFESGQCIIAGKALGGRAPILCKFRQIKKLKTYSMV